MTSMDAFAFAKFTTSKDLPELLAAKGFNQIPSCPKTIKSIVMTFAENIGQLYRNQLKDPINQKFSLAFDEWTNQKNRRFINVNIHGAGSKFWNLGLIRMVGSMPSEARLGLIENRLEAFGLTLEKDVICFTTDGDSVMKKIGRISLSFQQLCFAHGLQLAIVDTMYKTTRQPTDEKFDVEGESEDDGSEESDYSDDEDANFEIEDEVAT
jgi:hypothetical protein